MSDSYITKSAIADGLKKLTREKSFDKISIKDITDQCGLNRQTFYYHFQDKYELLNWIYYKEGFSVLTEGITFENWHTKLEELLMKIKKEQYFYGNTVRHDENTFEDYLQSITAALFKDAIEELDEQKVVSEENKKFISDFFSFGICGSVLTWMKSGMKESPSNVAAKLKLLAKSSEKLAYYRYMEWNS